MTPSELKRRIKREAKKFGANLCRVAPASRWEEYAETGREFFPRSIWPWSESVIVLAVQIFPPMIETTPSIVYAELYNTANRLLDETAYRLANFLNAQGQRAIFFPRDGYGDISVLVDTPTAAFSHVLAGKYAGLGTVGANHTLLTKEYGSRVRLVSVITDAELPPDPVLYTELCANCGLCRARCPIGAFSERNGELIADMDKRKCAEHHQRLKNEYRFPCGVCVMVCPVGDDRKIYGMASVSERGAEHCRSFGSKRKDE
ncbi:MAG: epoxyqueuosine reductase [Clostridiales bacterium]|jgi:O-acetylhomoserine (thiol)-lyase|nr:epoxyqueuosine reductase [Clostridiales bacterium]